MRNLLIIITLIGGVVSYFLFANKNKRPADERARGFTPTGSSNVRGNTTFQGSPEELLKRAQKNNEVANFDYVDENGRPVRARGGYRSNSPRTGSYIP
jgi:hypothetical protein